MTVLIDRMMKPYLKVCLVLFMKCLFKYFYRARRLAVEVAEEGVEEEGEGEEVGVEGHRLLSGVLPGVLPKSRILENTDYSRQ